MAPGLPIATALLAEFAWCNGHGCQRGPAQRGDGEGASRRLLVSAGADAICYQPCRRSLLLRAGGF